MFTELLNLEVIYQTFIMLPDATLGAGDVKMSETGSLSRLLQSSTILRMLFNAAPLKRGSAFCLLVLFIRVTSEFVKTPTLSSTSRVSDPLGLRESGNFHL